MNQLASIHIIRFIASMAVVFYHFLPGIRSGHSGTLLNNSNEFVNLFFFISGLVLSFSNAQVLLDKKISRKQFYINRIARLYPSYLLALLLVVACSVVYSIDLGKTTYLKLPFEALGIQTWLYPGSVNFPGWSLSVEMFFYISFPFIVTKYFSLIQQHLSKAFMIVGLYFLLVLIINFMAGTEESRVTVYLTSHYGQLFSMIPSYLEYYPLLRIGYFIAGILSYFLIFRSDGNCNSFVKKNTILVFTISLVSILLILMHISKSMEIYLRSGFLAPFYIFLFMSLAMFNEKTQTYLSNKLFIFLGAISYGIYIFQYPLQLIYENSIHPINSTQQFLFYSLFLIISCSIIYLFYESVLNKWIRNKWR